MRFTVRVEADNKRWKQVKKRLIQGNNYSNRIGWLKPKLHKSERSQNILLAQIAKWAEEGSITVSDGKYIFVPPRPFIRIGFIDKVKSSPVIRNRLASSLLAVSNGQMTWNAFYKALGEDLVKIMKEVINEWNSPPNSPYTIRMKGFNNPLIETGYMRDNVESDVYRG